MVGAAVAVVDEFLPCCCAGRRQFLAKLESPADSPFEPALETAALIREKLTAKINELKSPGRDLGALADRESAAASESGTEQHLDEGTEDSTRGLFEIFGGSGSVRQQPALDVEVVDAADPTTPQPISLKLRQQVLGRAPWVCSVCECNQVVVEDSRNARHLCYSDNSAVFAVTTILQAFRYDHPPETERSRGWEGRALKLFREKHCEQNRLGMPDDLWEFFLAGRFVGTAFERKHHELCIGEVPGVAPGLQVNSRIELELLRIHEKWMEGIAFVFQPGVGSGVVHPCTAVATKALPAGSQALPGHRVQYADSWEGTALDYCGAGGNDTSYSQEQLQEQTFDMRTNAGKANTSLKQAGIHKTPVRVVQQVESGRYEYRGLFAVTAARRVAKMADGQTLQQFDRCVNPVCQRARAEGGRKEGQDCDNEGHRWKRPMRQIRFTLKPWAEVHQQ